MSRVALWALALGLVWLTVAGYPLILPTGAGLEARYPEEIWGYGDITPFGLIEVTFDRFHRVAAAVYASGLWHPQAGTMICAYHDRRLYDHDWLTPIDYRCDCCLLLLIREFPPPEIAGEPPPYLVGPAAAIEPVSLGAVEGALVRGVWLEAGGGETGNGEQALVWSGETEYVTLRWRSCGRLFEIRARMEDGGFTFDRLAWIAADIQLQTKCE